jgi:putative nucleotidyltransferase with HDIG domain
VTTAGPDLAARLADQEPVQIARGALAGEGGVWIVGGAVRDAALARPVTDIDLAVSGDPGSAARRIADAGNGFAFELSAEFGSWRAAARDRSWQIDVTALRGEDITADLALRDFTIGAVAVPLGGEGLLDPHGGLADLDRGVLRVVGPAAFEDDPLRLLRAPRLAAELGLEVEGETAGLARSVAPSAAAPAGERQLAELRALIAGPDPLGGFRLMEELGVTAAVLPEVEAMRGVEQGPNHHLDVYDHTLAVLANALEIETDLARFTGDRAGEVADFLAEPLADDFSRRDALRFGALLHDVGKPDTARDRGGYPTFIGHDASGADIAAAICRRLRASRRLGAHVADLARHHLRLGFLVSQRPLPARTVHEYLRVTGDVAVDVTLLTVADRLAARGSGPIAGDDMVRGHLELAGEMISAALDWRREGPPRPLLAGDELAAELGIQPGPSLGEALAELEAAQYAGEVTSREGAVRHAREVMARGAGAQGAGG